MNVQQQDQTKLLYLGNEKHRDFLICLQNGSNSPLLYTTFQNEPDTLVD